jgi:hypothetical protein
MERYFKKLAMKGGIHTERGTDEERGRRVEKGCRDKLSLNGVSLDIVSGIISLLDFETLIQSIHDQCVPSLECNQTVDNHYSYLQQLGFPKTPRRPKKIQVTLT